MNTYKGKPTVKMVEKEIESLGIRIKAAEHKVRSLNGRPMFDGKQICLAEANDKLSNLKWELGVQSKLFAEIKGSEANVSS